MPCKDLTQGASTGLSLPHPHPRCTSPDLDIQPLATVLDTPVPCVGNSPMGGSGGRSDDTKISPVQTRLLHYKLNEGS